MLYPKHLCLKVVQPPDLSFVVLVLAMFGSRKTIKTFMTKSEGAKNLGKRARENIKKKFDDFNASGSTPSQVQTIIDPIQENIKLVKDELKVKDESSSGSRVVLNALERLGDGDLLKVKQIFEQDKDKKSRTPTEDKILAMAYLVVPEVSSIDNIIPHLYKAKMDLINTFTEAFAHEFNYQKGNETVFDCDGFLSELKDLLAFRKGHRKGALSRDSESVEVVREEGCSVM